MLFWWRWWQRSYGICMTHWIQIYYISLNSYIFTRRIRFQICFLVCLRRNGRVKDFWFPISENRTKDTKKKFEISHLYFSREQKHIFFPSCLFKRVSSCRIPLHRKPKNNSQRPNLKPNLTHNHPPVRYIISLNFREPARPGAGEGVTFAHKNIIFLNEFGVVSLQYFLFSVRFVLASIVSRYYTQTMFALTGTTFSI